MNGSAQLGFETNRKRMILSGVLDLTMTHILKPNHPFFLQSFGSVG